MLLDRRLDLLVQILQAVMHNLSRLASSLINIPRQPTSFPNSVLPSGDLCAAVPIDRNLYVPSTIESILFCIVLINSLI